MSLALQSHSAKSSLKQTNNFVSDPTQCVRLANNNSALALRMHRSIQPSNKTNNSDSDHARRVCLTKIKASLGKQRPNQNSNHINCLKVNST